MTPEELGVGKNKETKLVVWFTNDACGLVLNKTNNRTLRGAFGDDTAGWANKVIAVFPTVVDIRGKMGPRCGCASRHRSRLQRRLRRHSRRHRHRPAMALRQQHRHRRRAVDPELEPDPKLSVADELNDEIPEKW